MRTVVFVLLGALAASGRANAADPMVYAADLGTQLGKATFCGFDTDEFLERSHRALDAHFKDEAKRNEATQVLVAAAASWGETGRRERVAMSFALNTRRAFKL
jgi:hypothetical protein